MIQAVVLTLIGSSLILTGISIIIIAFSTSNYPEMPMTTVSSLELSRYLGKWYEIARLPNSFQKYSYGDISTADYSLHDDGYVLVQNSVVRKDGSKELADGAARCPKPKQHPSRFEVTFVPSWLRWIPFVWGKYWVIGLDSDYKWSVVGHPNRQYFWILAREPQLDAKTFEQIKVNATTILGYDFSELIVSCNITQKTKF